MYESRMESYISLKHQVLQADSKIDLFEDTYRNYHLKLETYASTFVGTENARDIVQDVFMQLWESMDTSTPVYSIYFFLRRVIYNRCLDWIRHQRIEERYVSQMINVSDSSYDDTESTVAYKELNAEYQRILSSMPSKRKNVYLLQQSKGLSIVEISNRMNISVKTVDCHLANARSILRSKLSVYYSV